jgi:hypothetical protein
MGLMITAMGIANVVVKRALLVPLTSQQPAGNRDRIIPGLERLGIHSILIFDAYLAADPPHIRRADIDLQCVA